MPALFVFILLALFSSQAAAQSSTLVSVRNAVQGEIVSAKSYVGNLEYTTSSRIAAERSGRVKNVKFEEGDSVKQGQILLEIDKDILMHTITAAIARLEQQKLSLDKAKRDFDRAQLLFKENAAPEQRYMDAETDYQLQLNAYSASAAELNVLKEDLKRSSITAPYDAVVISKETNIGEWVNTGATVYEIVKKQIEVVVNIPQSVIQNIQTGSSVDIDVEGRHYQGKVRAIVPLGNSLSRTFPVKVDVLYHDELLGGMDATVSFSIGEKQPAILVPIDSVVKRNGVDVVFTVQDGKARMIPVKIIGYSGANAGIQSNEPVLSVITRGNERLMADQNVRVAQ